MRVDLKSASRILLVLVFTIVVAAMVVPYSALQFMLREFDSLKDVLNFLDTVAPQFQLDHLLSFGALGFAAHFGWHGRRPWRVAIAVGAVAVIVEVAQVWIPGREAAVSHATLGLLGGLFGFGIAWLLSYAWGSESLPDPSGPSTIM
jgi:VanZ family protein